MLDATDPGTVRSTRLLFDRPKSSNAPLTLWIGAGASSWCGYPRWPELAEICHSAFQRYEPRYDANLGRALLGCGNFPALFQACRDVSHHRFNVLLSTAFSPREPTPVYRRFLRSIIGIAPVCVLTTNVDELLEKGLPMAATVERQDLERVSHLLSNQKSVVCKLHGSISDIKSTIFTTADYGNLVADSRYITLLQRIIATTSVVFIGYGIQDEYLISLLRQNHDLAELFGDGPHFAVLPNASDSLPSSVRIVRYLPEPHRDHRTSISVIEEYSYVRNQQNDRTLVPDLSSTASRTIRSAHMLFDILPPGTWNTSNTLGLTDEKGSIKEAVIGTGFSSDELPDNRSTAMHDVIVGLLCFDEVVAPIQALGRLHNLVGADRFWRLVRENILSFVNWSQQEGIIFPSADSVGSGDLGSMSLFNPDRTKKTIAQIIRGQLKPSPGMEEEANRLMSMLEARTREISSSEEGGIPRLVRGLLLRPSVREVLGISRGTPLNSFARWQVFPVLRLASVVRIGAACRVLGIGSAKLDFGTARLAGPAFASVAGSEWTDDTASYVTCGRFGADLGNVALRDPSIFDAVLRFRESSHGRELRAEVLTRLAASEGAEVNVAVNSALRAGVPQSALQAARDQFVQLHVSGGGILVPPPAIWNDSRYADVAVARWRRRSRAILEEWCSRIGVDQYGYCPCGSGEKLKFCCDEALRTS